MAGGRREPHLRLTTWRSAAKGERERGGSGQREPGRGAGRAGVGKVAELTHSEGEELEVDAEEEVDGLGGDIVRVSRAEEDGVHRGARHGVE
jgi:hypothetical protein